MKHRFGIVKVVLLAVVAAMALEYIGFAIDHPEYSRAIVMGQDDRPYVYRALVPFVARCLTWTGMRADVALTVVVVSSAIGLVYGLIYFFSSQMQDDILRWFVWSAFGVLVFMLVFFIRRKSYDLSTAMFFAFGLGMMAQRKWNEYFALFAFANVNRETSVLLMVVWGIYALGDKGLRGKGYWVALGYQGYLFMVIRICLMVIFANNPGVAMLIRPIENLRLFAAEPGWAVVHWIIWGAILVSGFRFHVPGVARVAFWVLMPALTLMYLVMGVSFEIRVFAELFPVIWYQVSSFRLRGVK